MKKFLNLSKIAIAVFLVMTVLKGGQPCPVIDPNGITVLLPNPEDCSSFFMCSCGVPILQKCPEGLHFDATRNVCDWPSIANCDPSNCLSGGPGASGCSIGGGIDAFGFGGNVTCSVDCKDGYYACCSLTCRCIKE